MVTKIFLSSSGVLKVGEFPEYPSKPGLMSHQEFFTEYYEDDLPKYHKEVEAAKASAVEVPEMDSGKMNIAPTFNSGKMGYWYNGVVMQEGQLYDLPPGWTVEYGWQYKPNDQWEDCSRLIYNEFTCSETKRQGDTTETRKIARLVQSKPAGIVATGVPEPEQPYKLHEAVAEINEKMPNLFGNKDPTAEIIADRKSPVIPEGSEKPICETCGGYGKISLSGSVVHDCPDCSSLWNKALEKADQIPFDKKLAIEILARFTGNSRGTPIAKNAFIDGAQWAHSLKADKQAIDDTLKGPHYLTDGLAESYRHMYEDTLKENNRLRELLAAQPSPQAESEEDFIEAAENEAMKIEGCRPSDHNHDCPCGAFEMGAMWARERLTRKP